jgi:hypothetical protein
MLLVHDGALRYYDRQVVEDRVHDRWFRLNVVHDGGAEKVAVFVDGEEKLRAPAARTTTSSACTRRPTPPDAWSRDGRTSRLSRKID